jgi:hypothetical protein
MPLALTAETLMSQDEGSCPKNEKNDMQLCPFIGIWMEKIQISINRAMESKFILKLALWK